MHSKKYICRSANFSFTRQLIIYKWLYFVNYIEIILKSYIKVNFDEIKVQNLIKKNKTI